MKKSIRVKAPLASSEGPFELRNGKMSRIRFIRETDEPGMIAFHGRLSETSVYRRYFQTLPLDRRTQHDRLLKVCSNDDRNNAALVALIGRKIIGVGRLTRTEKLDTAEYAVIIEDDAQGLGLGTELLKRLLQIGGDWQIRRVIGYVLPDNYDMQRVCQRLGFKSRYDPKTESIVTEFRVKPD